MAPASRVVDVAGGDNPKITLQLVEPQATAPVVVPVPTPQVVHDNPQPPHPLEPTPVVHASSGPSTAFWIGLVATGTFAVATGVLGGVALASKSSFDAKIAQVGVQPSDVDSARNQTRAFALATDIAGGLAIASAITTVVLAFTTHKHAAAEPGPSAQLFFGPTSGVAGTF